MSRWLPWMALLAALSPILLELSQHALAFPWAAVWPLFFVLFFALEHRSPPLAPGERPPLRTVGRIGLVLTAIAVVVFVGGREPRLARLALPLGFVSMACLLGRPGWRTSLLALWLLPIPSAIPDLVHPQLTDLWLRLTEGLVPGVERVAPPRPLADPGLGRSGSPVTRFAVHEGFNGIALAWALCGVGAFSALFASPDASWLRIARSGALHGLWGLPAQAAVIVGSGCVLALSGSSAAGAFALGWGWTLPLAAAVVRGLRGRSAPSGELVAAR